jgi:hypothetical protein
MENDLPDLSNSARVQWHIDNPLNFYDSVYSPFSIWNFLQELVLGYNGIGIATIIQSIYPLIILVSIPIGFALIDLLIKKIRRSVK